MTFTASHLKTVVGICILIALIALPFRFLNSIKTSARSREPAGSYSVPVVPADAKTITHAQILASVLAWDLVALSKMDNDQLGVFCILSVALGAALLYAANELVDTLGKAIQRIIHGGR
jgi:hypothetical protein